MEPSRLPNLTDLTEQLIGLKKTKIKHIDYDAAKDIFKNIEAEMNKAPEKIEPNTLFKITDASDAILKKINAKGKKLLSENAPLKNMHEACEEVQTCCQDAPERIQKNIGPQRFNIEKRIYNLDKQLNKEKTNLKRRQVARLIVAAAGAGLVVGGFISIAASVFFPPLMFVSVPMIILGTFALAGDFASLYGELEDPVEEHEATLQIMKNLNDKIYKNEDYIEIIQQTTPLDKIEEEKLKQFIIDISNCFKPDPHCKDWAHVSSLTDLNLNSEKISPHLSLLKQAILGYPIGKTETDISNEARAIVNIKYSVY